MISLAGQTFINQPIESEEFSDLSQTFKIAVADLKVKK
jgi:hypothetical protein